ncbi:3-deoxy-D-arabino-heptulosonate 7-phosphate synthase [Fulvivirga sp. M361]|uniref:3-deoxy-D-arabino-heptulosonate 7-phosphate synthase n=1 Tax=Fulvivirga sp. M361 TaxID=2594266 RepID=UPI00117B9C1D|nr:3-deoxy-D-arabino-heptulosonate 7-phosphate synthase [Fulvivirga sp. M361]TRX62166.1 3-deoxy-D-arabino-heptulosonate 7-phosphate synthase [Fulvivirga sp. M361]
MIIPKESKLTKEQLKEVTDIANEYSCKIQTIEGHHRTIYALLGEEREPIMINRILGLDYIDRFDAIDSPYKLMDIHSELANHKIVIGGHIVGESPFIIGGQCTIDPDNPNYFIETAHAMKEAGAKALRGGVWKPRTMPYAFQGDDSSIKVLVEAREQTGLPIDTEVMDEYQLDIALEAEVDVLQIGTRNALNYSLLKKIGEKTANSNMAVLLKRTRAMGPVNELIAASEYIVAGGNPNVMLCPRGTIPQMEGYRNNPDESITPLLKEKTWAPVVVDPSHSVGRAKYVPGAALAAIAYGADGLIIESHIDPKYGIGDDPKQAVTPEVLTQLIKDATTIWNIARGEKVMG